MDDSFKMTVTINQLVSPLLYDALSGCQSARQRAMRLRGLAESALRQPAQRGETNVVALTSPPAAVERAPADLTSAHENSVQLLRVDDFATGIAGADPTSLGDQLAEFF